MTGQQLTGTSLWIHNVVTTSRSPRDARIVLTMLAIHQAIHDGLPGGDTTPCVIDLLDLADLSDKSPGDVRDAIRTLNQLGELAYTIRDREISFRLTGGDR